MAEKVKTIQKTSKKWKGLQLVGMLAICVGIFGCFTGVAQDEPSLTCSAISWTIGVPALIIGRFGAWWNHA